MIEIKFELRLVRFQAYFDFVIADLFFKHDFTIESF